MSLIHIFNLSSSSIFTDLIAPKSALILGATGQTGRMLLRELLASPQFTKVGEYGRNVTPASDISIGKDKLEQKVINFDKIDEAGLAEGRWDVVYITSVHSSMCAPFIAMAYHSEQTRNHEKGCWKCFRF